MRRATCRGVALRRIGVVDEFGRERERYKIPYGATITVTMPDIVTAGQSSRMGSALTPWSRKWPHDQVLRLRRRHHRHSQVDDVTGPPALWCWIRNSVVPAARTCVRRAPDQSKGKE